MVKCLIHGFNLLLFFTWFSAWAEPVPPAARGIWLQGRENRFYQVVSKAQGVEIQPASLQSNLATPPGLTTYPLLLTSIRDGIPESDLITGQDYGPAILLGQWDREHQTLSATYSNGYYHRKVFNQKVPTALSGIEDAFLDAHSNVFWIKKTITGETRIFHQNAKNRDIPLNELIFGSAIQKVRGNPDGTGIVVLVQNGMMLNVEIPADFSLRVTPLNRPEVYPILDFEVGPLTTEPAPFSLLSQGINMNSSQVEVRTHDPLHPKLFQTVPLSYLDPFRRLQKLDWMGGIFSNVHPIELEKLTSVHPSQLNRFFQIQYEAQEYDIELQLHRSNTEDPLLPSNSVKRKVILDERTPGLCRYYVLPNYGLSPDLYVN